MPQSRYTSQEQIEEMRREIQLEKQKISGRLTCTSNARHPKERTVFKITGWIVFFSVVSVLVAAIISINMAKNRGEIPNVWGFQVFSVESGSMEPTLQIGTLIVSRKTNHPESLKANQIVTFRTLSGYIVTHRIIEVVTTSSGNTAYRMKGDNPVNSPDEDLLTPDRVIGIFVAKIPFTLR
ncbi:MAG: Signal peptidase I W [Candidatus Dichloromethanomonas elyunquensis]|nr:MAG: Signal peptidase I W [Candidatus Dichloromethanomonas elyunquensis]